ncbi:MAG: methyl-accepting chemotaxis protein, partial [Candidatus Thiodiazotropha sp. LLP2]
VNAVSKVAEMINQISVASAQQSSGISEVNKAVSQMDEMTQQNAALVEQVSAAGDAMAEQARNMRRQLGFFKMEKNAGSDQTEFASSASLALVSGESAIKPNIANDEWNEF